METEADSEERKSTVARVFFWILWIVFLVLIPIYLFTLSFEVSALKLENIGSILSPFVGLFVLISQIVIFVKAFRQARQTVPLSKPYLTLLGGSIVIGFIWAGGCAIMGPYRIAG